MENTESMTRDEILEAIRKASTDEHPDPLHAQSMDEIAERMEEVDRLADVYHEGEWDRQYLSEALSAALYRFATMVRTAR